MRIAGLSKPHSNKPLYSNTVIGKLAVHGRAVTFLTLQSLQQRLQQQVLRYRIESEHRFRCPNTVELNRCSL